jgi:peptidyl-tRNA hydrolase, PTH1 family
LSDRRTVAIVGLGNPGEGYDTTRHNAGFMAADALLQTLRISLRLSGSTYIAGEGSIEECDLVIVKPLTFMNNSGYAVAEILGRYGLTPDRALIISDDIALPLGSIRVRSKGTHGGHNGLRSVIATLGTIDFPRIRCGIRGPAYDHSPDLAEYVLAPFDDAERTVVEEMVGRAAEAAIAFASEGIDETMNTFNT